MSDPRTAIAERLERASKTWLTQPIGWVNEAEELLAEAAQVLRASADEVEQLRKAHRDADEQWGLASRAHQKAEADLASARKALEVIAGPRNADLDYRQLHNESQAIATEALRASTIEGLPGPRSDDLSIMRGEAEPTPRSDGRQPPAGYVKLKPGVQCRCVYLWRQAMDEHWCCGAVHNQTEGR